MELSAGDWVWLGEQAKATLWSFDGSSALLSGLAQVGIDRSEEVVKRFGSGKSVVELRMASGRMLTEVAPMATDSSVFSIRTPFGAVRSGSAVFEVNAGFVERSGIVIWYRGRLPKRKRM